MTSVSSFGVFNVKLLLYLAGLILENEGMRVV